MKKLIKLLEEAEAKATPAPWKGREVQSRTNGMQVTEVAGKDTPVDGFPRMLLSSDRSWSHGKENATLAVEVRNVLPGLLKVLKAAEKLADAVEDMTAGFAHRTDEALRNFRSVSSQVEIP